MAKQLAFYFNGSVCTGCKACVIACKDRSDLPVGVNWRRVYQYESGGWATDPANPGLMIPNNLTTYSVSISCMHCENPKCVEVCPTQAMHKNADGIVSVNQDACIGCRYCEWACPYGAPQYLAAKGVMSKCDFCQDLQAKGENPVCVDACVTRAIEFGDLEELRAKYGSEAEVEPLPPANLTQPAFVMTPHRHAQSSSHGTGHIISLNREA